MMRVPHPFIWLLSGALWLGTAYAVFADQTSIRIPETSTEAKSRSGLSTSSFDDVVRVFLNPALKTITSNFLGTSCTAISTPQNGQWCFDTGSRTVKMYSPNGSGVYAWNTAFLVNSDGSLSPSNLVAGAVSSVAGRSGSVVLTSADLTDSTAFGRSIVAAASAAAAKALLSIGAGDVSGLAASATTDTTNASNISAGTLPAGRIPVPSATTLGGVQSAAAVTHQFITSISTFGVPALAQPVAADISGLSASATIDATNASNIGTGTLGCARLPALTGDITSTSCATTLATVPITKGGTGATTLPSGILKGAGTSAITAATAGTDYLAPAGNGSALTSLTVSQLTNRASYFPGLSTSVQATGFAGLDGGAWFLYQNPTSPTYNTANANTLRVDRNANYTGGAAGNLSAIWGNCTASAADTTYEWCSKFTMDNLATGAAQNLSINATTTAHTGSSPSWATNFVLQNLDGETDPTNVRVNSEFDLFVNGTDANKVRHNIELILARPSNAGAAAYAMSGMWINAGSGSTYQNGILFDNGGTVPGAGTGSGAYIVGINMAGASYSGAAIGIPSLSKIALDLAPSGTFNRSISFTALGLTYATGSGNALLVDDSGNVKALTSVRSTVKTFATLPACSGTNEGAMVPVTDSTSQTFGATMAGGGGFHVQAYCNSAVWTIH